MLMSLNECVVNTHQLHMAMMTLGRHANWVHLVSMHSKASVALGVTN